MGGKQPPTAGKKEQKTTENKKTRNLRKISDMFFLTGDDGDVFREAEKQKQKRETKKKKTPKKRFCFLKFWGF
jgi:hypothetical protein